MKIFKVISLLLLIALFTACGTSHTKTIDQLPESYIQGVEDLGQATMSLSEYVFDENGRVDEEATSTLNKRDEYNLETLTAVNTEQEFTKIKYFLYPQDIKKFEAIDYTQKTLLFASQKVQVDAKSPAIAIKTIKYDANNHIHCVIYRDKRLRKGGLSLPSMTGMYHAYLIPKTKKEDISYEVIDL